MKIWRIFAENDNEVLYRDRPYGTDYVKDKKTGKLKVVRDSQFAKVFDRIEASTLKI